MFGIIGFLICIVIFFLQILFVKIFDSLSYKALDYIIENNEEYVNWKINRFLCNAFKSQIII